MTSTANFRAAIDEAWSVRGNEPALLPDALASAARVFLGSDGASLSVLAAELRVPLGASDPVSALAERLQFTSGDGRCLRAIRSGTPVMASAADLEEGWPLLADVWATRTPFRSALALPVPVAGGLGISLNLFYEGDDGGAQIIATAAATVVLELRRRLSDTTLPTDGRPHGEQPLDVPVLSTPAALQRQLVWVALGVIVLATGLEARDALARLRSRAMLENRSVDEIARRIVEDPDSAADLAP